MICGANDLPSELDAGNAVIIVGSGPVGLVIARRFAQLEIPTLVLEAGEERLGDTDRDSLEVEFGNQSLPGMSVGRTRQLGGGLNLWGGQLARFHASELIPASGSKHGWPVGVQELTAPLELATELLGQSSWPVLPPAEIVAMEKSLARFDLQPVVTTWLPAPKWPRSVWSDLSRTQTIRIVLGLAADSVRLDAKGTGVVGVTARARDGTMRFLRASRVVVAAGTIESIRLLLQPDENGQPQPWHALPWLGRGFCEHLDAAVATVSISRSRPLVDMFDPVLAGGIKQTWKLFGQLQVANDTILSGVVMMGLPNNARNAISELSLLMRGLTPRAMPARAPELFATILASGREVGPLAWRYLRHRRIGSMLRGRAILRASVEQPVRWENRISLAAARDCLGIRRAQIDWRTGIEEGEVFRVLTKRAGAWLEAIGAGRVTTDLELERTPSEFARRADDGLHHAGGARMGLSPSTSVVSQDLQVHGVPGLYVCGASVFPRPGFANPTLMAAALGVRLADHVAKTSYRCAA